MLCQLSQQTLLSQIECLYAELLPKRPRFGAVHHGCQATTIPDTTDWLMDSRDEIAVSGRTRIAPTRSYPQIRQLQVQQRQLLYIAEL